MGCSLGKTEKLRPVAPKGEAGIYGHRGSAAERIIETGLENLTDVEVTRGLAKNERVVTSGFETLSSKSKVKIIK